MKIHTFACQLFLNSPKKTFFISWLAHKQYVASLTESSGGVKYPLLRQYMAETGGIVENCYMTICLVWVSYC